VTSLAESEYNEFEILVVDDQSRDRTAAVVEELNPGNARGIRVIRGAPLPEGWLGKPWACQQGAREASGEVFLFTDADTRHGPATLARALRGLLDEKADVLTLMGRQLMESFWEQLLQPQFFLLLAFRYPRVGRPRDPGSWRNAIANGQYLLFRRDVYERVGGHEAVAGEVVEDLRFAQILAQNGFRVMVRGCEGLETRMYRSLRGLVQGWSKNIATGALQTTSPRLLPLILPLSLLAGVLLWTVPVACLAWCLFTQTGGLVLWWSGIVTCSSALFWASASAIMRGNPLYGALYPLGSVVSAYIFVRSWRRGSRVHWKGREYRVGSGTWF